MTTITSPRQPVFKYICINLIPQQPAWPLLAPNGLRCLLSTGRVVWDLRTDSGCNARGCNATKGLPKASCDSTKCNIQDIQDPGCAEESKWRGSAWPAGLEDSFPGAVCGTQKALVGRRGGGATARQDLCLQKYARVRVYSGLKGT